MPSILFCLWGAPGSTYGGGRVYLELIEGLRVRGWKVDVISLPSVKEGGKNACSQKDRHAILRQHILSVQDAYDVVEYDLSPGGLPFPRSDFRSDMILAARSVLLELHFERIQIPSRPRLRSRIKQWLLRDTYKKVRRQISQALIETARQADLVHVSTQEDVTELVRFGVTKDKIVLLPYGLSNEEVDALLTIRRSANPGPRVLFLGTFDWRKGAADMPEILRRIGLAHPDARFRLAGTKGLFPDEASVRAEFPHEIQSRIEIIPRYERHELKGILQDCDVGIFPSYLEGFGISVLEQNCAGIPVIAYRSPGPTMILPDECLVTAGDIAALAEKVSRLLSDSGDRQRLATQLRARAEGFTWDRVLDALDKIYRDRLTLLKQKTAA